MFRFHSIHNVCKMERLHLLSSSRKFASTLVKRPFSTSAPSLAERPNLNERHNCHGGRMVVPRPWNARSIYLLIYPSIRLSYLIQNSACHIKASLFQHPSTLPKNPHSGPTLPYVPSTPQHGGIKAGRPTHRKGRRLSAEIQELQKISCWHTNIGRDLGERSGTTELES